MWLDEVYAGPDSTLGFGCPRVDGAGLHFAQDAQRPLQYGWSAAALGAQTRYAPMSRHSSHLSRRLKYQHDNGGLLFRDGYELTSFHSDIATRTPDGDKTAKAGGVSAGALLFVPRRGDGKVTPGSRVNADMAEAAETRDLGVGAGAKIGRASCRERV